jgi:hypothetical protein
MEPANVFNPLDKRNLGKSVVDALLEVPAMELEEVGDFKGAGIYAIYYRGAFEPYQVLGSLNAARAEYPIYVGKAVPKGGRKGAMLDASPESTALSSRLKEHKNSILAASSLDIRDFQYRCLVVDDIWITLGETLVIQRFLPLWNHVVEGFGNHDPGAGRHAGKRPLWDEIHPGRTWAGKCKPPGQCRAEILLKIAGYMIRLKEDHAK